MFLRFRVAKLHISFGKYQELGILFKQGIGFSVR